MEKPGDFKIFYDSRLKRNYWLLGYFGGGAVNILSAFELGKEYSETYNVPFNTVQIDEVLRSRRYKHFKFIYSTEKQTPDKDAMVLDNVYGFLTD